MDIYIRKLLIVVVSTISSNSCRTETTTTTWFNETTGSNRTETTQWSNCPKSSDYLSMHLGISLGLGLPILLLFTCLLCKKGSCSIPKKPEVYDAPV